MTDAHQAILDVALAPLADDELERFLSGVYVSEGFTDDAVAATAFNASAVRARGRLFFARGASGALVGTVILVPSSSPARHLAGSGEAELHLLAVAFSERGSGLGRALVARALETARADGYARIWLWTQPNMHAAQRLYERAGFVRRPARDFERAGRAFLVYELALSAAPFLSPRGRPIPRLLYGTAWKGERTAELVERALGLGFRGIDSACQPKHYDEAGVGAGVAAALAHGLARSQLFLQTKFTPLSGQDPRRIPYDSKASLTQQVQQSHAVSLANLRTTYLDSLVVHSPLAPFERLLEVWRALEELVDGGSVRELGISNCYDLALLERLWQAARTKPLMVQNRFYRDTQYDRTIRAFCRTHGLIYQSFWTLSANPKILADARLRKLAKHYDSTPEQLFFRALTQVGILPLTGTTSEEHMREDLAIFDFELPAPELAELAAIWG